MSKSDTRPSAGNIVPSGQLIMVDPYDLVPNPNNPRMLFDPEPLQDLKENIRVHGVLVPVTVFRQPGSKKYEILDGARRHRCCLELLEEGIKVVIPANVVTPPDRISGLLYMFSIHNFREAWELMPTALSLKVVIKELGESDTKKLCNLTGLSEPQVERCKLLLSYPEKYQNYSLDPNPETRIPSNFWIEADPVLTIATKELPELFPKGDREPVLDMLVGKYRAKKIRSVVHFRRVVEAHDVSEDQKEERKRVVGRLKEFLTDPNTETRKLFDEFVTDSRRISTALTACDDFIRALERAKIKHVIEKDREDIRQALKRVQSFIRRMLELLEGSDPPYAKKD